MDGKVVRNSGDGDPTLGRQEFRVGFGSLIHVGGGEP